MIRITVKGPTKSQINRMFRDAESKLKREIERHVRQKTGKQVKWVKR